MELSTTTEGDTLRVVIKGEFDAKTVPQARPTLESATDSSPKKVVVDLSDLRLIDSTGVGGIVALFKRVRASGGQFKVLGVRGQPRSIFQLLCLDRVFDLEDVAEQ